MLGPCYLPAIKRQSDVVDAALRCTRGTTEPSLRVLGEGQTGGIKIWRVNKKFSAASLAKAGKTRVREEESTNQTDSACV